KNKNSNKNDVHVEIHLAEQKKKRRIPTSKTIKSNAGDDSNNPHDGSLAGRIARRGQTVAKLDNMLSSINSNYRYLQEQPFTAGLQTSGRPLSNATPVENRDNTEVMRTLLAQRPVTTVAANTYATPV